MAQTSTQNLDKAWIQANLEYQSLDSEFRQTSKRGFRIQGNKQRLGYGGLLTRHHGDEDAAGQGHGDEDARRTMEEFSGFPASDDAEDASPLRVDSDSFQRRGRQR